MSAAKKQKDEGWISWGLIILLFIFNLSPLALLLLFLKLFGVGSGEKKQVKSGLHPRRTEALRRGRRTESFSKSGAPAKTQRSGFRGERTSIGMSELSA